MASVRGPLGRAATFAVTALGLAAAGCLHPAPGAPLYTSPGRQPMLVPPPGTVPSELNLATLPEYVIGPPDQLRIEAYIVTTFEDRKRARQEEKEREKREKAEGAPEPGKKDDKDPAKKDDADTDSGGPELRSLPLQTVYNDFQVRPDGTVFLGTYGNVQVAGYTLTQAAAAVRDALAKQVYDGRIDPKTLRVLVDVTSYASKRYYVIYDGGGNGEQVYWFTPTGSETVLDAVSNVNGLNTVASKRDIWVARRCPTPGQPDQVLPVDWVGITQYGVTATNYQIFPGDRVYVKAQPLVTIDTQLARLLNPVERLFGITLLGSSTVNNISGRGLTNNGQ